MTAQQMREKLKNDSGYGGMKWKLEVEAMSESQVIAIYYRMLKKGQIKGASR
jgi:hypothetical protein